MIELRFDLTTRDWVLLAPGRVDRPDANGKRPPAACPFCPGNEDATPPELERTPGPDGGWLVRAFPNLYPLLAEQEDVPHAPAGFASAAGLGTHEVVVEAPGHDWNPADADPAQILRVLRTYRRRHLALRTTGAAVVVIFRNHGRAAGNSLPHPHTQIMAAPVVPGGLHHAYEVARRYRAEHDEDLYADLVRREVADGARIVAETGSFVAFVPFAASVPGETWIVPRVHRPGIADATPEELADLSRLLPALLAATRDALDDPAYNLMVLGAPELPESAVAYPWHVRLLPRVSTPGGFELATGARVNTQAPEVGARLLREALAARGPTG